MLRWLLSLIVLIVGTVGSIEIENGVVGLPEVDCMDEMVKMRFRTQRPFTGRIFVKGMADKDSCVSSYRTNGDQTVEYRLQNGQCNMRRQRRLGPQKGIEHSMTVIISFHDTFITKVDRAYRCTCFFMEADKIVTSSLEVSMLPTVDLIDTAKMPLCTYSVRAGAIDGPVMTYAKVGDVAFHVWRCDSDMFGMLVHSCAVDDGSGQGRFQLLDNQGCSVDAVILSDLTYNQEATQAHVQAQVFKFADKANVYFQCSISLCMKNDGACARVTPPTCNRTRVFRQRRRVVPSKTEELHQSDMDISPGTLTVFDIDDFPEIDQQRYRSIEHSPARIDESESDRRREERRQIICMNAVSLGGVVASLVVMAVVTTATIFYARKRRPDVVSPKI